MTPTNFKHTTNGLLLAIAVLVVCSFVLTLISSMIPRMNRHGNPPAVSCRMALSNLDSAKTLCAAELHLTNGAVVTEQAVAKYLFHEQFPVCRKGGRYTIGVIGVAARCSVHGTAEVDTPLATHTNSLLPEEPKTRR
jgi:hypothetical protein